jgi:hypothetical protein
MMMMICLNTPFGNVQVILSKSTVIHSVRLFAAKVRLLKSRTFEVYIAILHKMSKAISCRKNDVDESWALLRLMLENNSTNLGSVRYVIDQYDTKRLY